MCPAGPTPRGPARRGAEPIVRAVRRTVIEKRLLSRGDSVLVAVSGGPDSVALLHILRELACGLDLKLAAAHLHHEIRGPDADGDEIFVRELAHGLGIACHVQRSDVTAYARRRGLGLEEAGRRVRYAFFRRIARRHGYVRIALGHQRDDNAETVLISLLRGSGAAGLGGIAPHRGDGVVRPLIEIGRRDVLAYLYARGLAFRRDASNRDRRFLRNRVRHDLVPRLRREYNPALSASLSRLADVIRTEDAWLRELTATLMADSLIERRPDRLVLSVDRLRGQHPAGRRRVLRRAIEILKGDLRRIAFGHVLALSRLVDSPRADTSCHLPGGLLARRSGGRLLLSSAGRGRQAAHPGPERPWCHRLAGPGNLVLPEAGAVLRVDVRRPAACGPVGAIGPRVALLDADRAPFPLTVRNRRPGDRFRPLGVGGRQKLKKFFCDHKVPTASRRRCPIVLSGRRIVWVAGHRIDEAARVTEATTSLLRLELRPRPDGLKPAQ